MVWWSSITRFVYCGPFYVHLGQVCGAEMAPIFGLGGFVLGDFSEVWALVSWGIFLLFLVFQFGFPCLDSWLGGFG